MTRGARTSGAPTAMPLLRKLGRRLLWAALVVFATVTLAFIVNSVLPSDPARMVAGPQARPAEVAKVRKRLWLDRPLYVQYARFITRFVHVAGAAPPPDDKEASAEHKEDHETCSHLFWRVHFDLGKSYQQRRLVVTILLERLPRTLVLALAAALAQASIGVAAGVLAAVRKRTAFDRLTVAMSLLGVSAPTFVTGLFFQWLFAYRLRLLPLDGFGETFGDHLASVVLPATTLGIFGAAYYTRMVRDEMIGQLGEDYVRTAKAKGLSRFSVVTRHALRNAMMPIITILGLEMGTLVGGAIVTESIFRWPGLGSLSVTAMLDRDGPLIMGCVLVTSIAVVLSTIAVDLAYAVLDPRVRGES